MKRRLRHVDVEGRAFAWLVVQGATTATLRVWRAEHPQNVWLEGSLPHAEPWLEARRLAASPDGPEALAFVAGAIRAKLEADAATARETMALASSHCLDELDPPAWGPPTYPSSLVTKCHALRRKPLSELSAPDLRVLIGQHIGLTALVPLALRLLEANPLVEAYYYPGDLLTAVLSIPSPYWLVNPEWRDRASRLVAGVADLPRDVADAAARFSADWTPPGE